MRPAYIALGSNLGEPRRQLSLALDALERLAGSEFVDCSPIYRSAAVGPGDQPDYLNAVAAIRTRLSPVALLRALQAIESDQGRRRELRWGARTLDLDILLYDGLVMESDLLTIPHPMLQRRNFVLYPLYDIAPQLTLPCGTGIASLLQRCSRAGLQVQEPQLHSMAGLK